MCMLPAYKHPNIERKTQIAEISGYHVIIEGTLDNGILITETFIITGINFKKFNFVS